MAEKLAPYMPGSSPLLSKIAAEIAFSIPIAYKMATQKAQEAMSSKVKEVKQKVEPACSIAHRKEAINAGKSILEGLLGTIPTFDSKFLEQIAKRNQDNSAKINEAITLVLFFEDDQANLFDESMASSCSSKSSNNELGDCTCAQLRNLKMSHFNPISCVVVIETLISAFKEEAKLEDAAKQLQKLLLNPPTAG